MQMRNTSILLVVVGVLLVFGPLSLMMTEGMPLLSEEGGFPSFRECEWGTVLWSFSICYGKQAIVLGTLLAGLSMIAVGSRQLMSKQTDKED